MEYYKCIHGKFEGDYCGVCGHIVPRGTYNKSLVTHKEPVAEVPCSAGLVAKLIEIDSLIRCVHLDMGGNDKYHISPRHNDQIGKLIKECLYIAESN